jgi:hypothetical protein
VTAGLRLLPQPLIKKSMRDISLSLEQFYPVSGYGILSENSSVLLKNARA